jgi:hypothetical protein
MNVSFWNFLDGTTTAKLQVQYGWRLFGLRAHSFTQDAVLTTSHEGSTARTTGYYAGSHFGGDKFLTQYLRTGSEKYYYINAIETQNFADLSVCHAPRSGYSEWNIAGTGTTITFPAGECMSMSHDGLDVYQRNYTGSHLNLAGMPGIYLLEKNYRYKEVLIKMSAWLATLVENWYPKNTYLVSRGYPPSRPSTEAEREVGNNLVTACKFVHTLNNPAHYDDIVKKITDYLIIWIKCTAPHYFDGTIVGEHNFAQGTGYFWADGNSNANVFKSSGCGPWMCGVILGGLAMTRDYSLIFTK